jgi:hypothetical protein
MPWGAAHAVNGRFLLKPLTAPLSVAIWLASGRGTLEGFDGLRRVDQRATQLRPLQKCNCAKMHVCTSAK